jgi:hypothetical protein
MPNLGRRDIPSPASSHLVTYEELILAGQFIAVGPTKKHASEDLEKWQTGL